ncbi:DUF1761 domain-containing protein [Pyruvatibacter mobilis]|uniref:DUF1761 domain-containing protein n=1 Tax=Pyruvatibacter mobilis TaxID=1712261 RepID=UPI003C7CDFD4
MDLISQLNWLAVLAAAIAGFATGAVWYGVFAKPWMEAAGLSQEDLTQSAALYVVAFALQVIMAVTIAGVIALTGITSWLAGALLGAGLGLGLVTANKALNASFQGTDKRLVLIDGLHAATAFAFMGAILGGWQ